MFEFCSALRKVGPGRLDLSRWGEGWAGGTCDLTFQTPWEEPD